MSTSAANYNPDPAADPAGAPLRTHRLTAPPDAAGSRLDQALAQLLPQHSRSRLKAWLEAGRVTVDGVVVQVARHKLAGGEVIVVSEGDHPDARVVAPQALALPIVFEDADLLVLDKPVGLVVHPGNGNPDGTLQNALLHHDPALADIPRAGIVHRLDKDTSGLMVVARTLEAQTALVRQLAARTVKREYLAVAYGDLAQATTIDAPIGRHPTQRTSMAVVERGKDARTHATPLERFGIATIVRCRLETGRTHQIRVHLTAIGHPLVGDATYRGKRRHAADALPAVRDFARQALHAQRLGLAHPRTGEAMAWEAAPPADIATLVQALREHAGPPR